MNLSIIKNFASLTVIGLFSGLPVSLSPQHMNIVPAPSSSSACDSTRLMVSLDDPDQSGTNIRSTPGGTVVGVLYQKSFPDGCCFEVVEHQNGWFRIHGKILTPEKDYSIKGGTGWVHKSVISVGTTNYGNETLYLRNKNNENGIVVAVIQSAVTGLRILDICGTWVKVTYQKTSGWISQDHLCGIPWTTCN